jgi:hypothetical protein
MRLTIEDGDVVINDDTSVTRMLPQYQSRHHGTRIAENNAVQRRFTGGETGNA